MKIKLSVPLQFEEGDTLEQINKGKKKITTIAKGTVLEGEFINKTDFKAKDGKIYYDLSTLDYRPVY